MNYRKNFFNQNEIQIVNYHFQYFHIFHSNIATSTQIYKIRFKNNIMISTRKLFIIHKNILYKNYMM